MNIDRLLADQKVYDVVVAPDVIRIYVQQPDECDAVHIFKSSKENIEKATQYCKDNSLRVRFGEKTRRILVKGG